MENKIDKKSLMESVPLGTIFSQYGKAFISCQTDQRTGYSPGENEHRRIVHNVQGFQHKGSTDQLTDVVADATDDADSGYSKPFELLEKKHGKEA